MDYFTKLFKTYPLKKNLFNASIFLFIALIIDHFNVFTFIINAIGYPAFISLILIFILIIHNLKIFNLLELKTINYFDYYLFILVMSILGFNLFEFAFTQKLIINNYLCNYKTNISVVALIISFLIFCKRNNNISGNHLSNKALQTNTFNLKQLYDGDIPNNIEYIYLKDEEVNYDLLNRSQIINHIYSTISNCHTDGSFVMALKGEWGSGKTTVLNIVKQKISSDDNIIYIDEFDPWIYEDEKQLMITLFDSIMKEIKLDFSIMEIEKFKKSYLSVLSFNTNYNVDFIINNKLDVSTIKNIINDYLAMNNKRIVLVLDNLERCSTNNILFLLKTIHNLFDFKNFIYILSYDEKIMKKHFDDNSVFDYSYLEKIIQLEFTLPKINDDLMNNLIHKCLNNILRLKNESFDLEDINQVAQILAPNIENIRDFIRVVNSTFNSSFGKTNYLNKVDLMIYELLYLKNNQLIDEIYENKLFYISEDPFIYSYEYLLNLDEYNHDTTEYFNKLFGENRFNCIKYKSLLSFLFPNVNCYLKNSRFGNIIKFTESYFGKDKDWYEKSILNRRIFNGKYFESYFIKNETEFVILNQNIEAFIKQLNENDDDWMIGFNKIINTLKGYNQKYTFETIQLYLNSIKKNKLINVLLALYVNYEFLDDTPEFFGLNSKERAVIDIVEIISLMPNEDFEEFINSIKKEYRYLYLNKSIIYWLNAKKKRNEIFEYNRLSIFEDTINQQIDTIKLNQVNLYSEENYAMHNHVLLFDDTDYIKFLKEDIDDDFLPLYILDSLSVSTGTAGFGYKYDIERIECIYSLDYVKNTLSFINHPIAVFLLKILNNKPNSIFDEENIYYSKKWISLVELTHSYLSYIKEKSGK